MGAFFTNLHIQTDSKVKVVELLRSKTLPPIYVSECENGWVSAFVQQEAGQDEEQIQGLAKDLSQALVKPALIFAVHDSDICCYWLYVEGQMGDSYNSNPDYFHDIPEKSKNQVAANPERLLPYCRQGITKDQIAKVLQGKMVFEENRVAALAGLMGIRPEYSTMDFSDILESEPEIQEQFTLIRETGSRGVSTEQMAFDAVKSGQVAALKSLIAAGASVYLKYPGGNLLGYAIAAGDPAMVKLLLDHGADPGKVNGDPFGRPPLIVATFSSAKSEIIELLVKAGSDINQAFDIQFSLSEKVSRVTPLMCAARFYQPELVKTLLKLGADKEIRDASGRNALDCALEKRARLTNLLAQAKDPNFLRECLSKVEQVIELLSHPIK
jgi:Ankyrin repeats (3 copies)/Ankyrin repeat